MPLTVRVGKLSGGQRAQVALALALAKRPELLLLDEPVASLDPLARREFLQALMGSVAEYGTTVLLSSHVLGDLERVCDYLIVLQAAQVQVLGGVEDLLASTRCSSAHARNHLRSPVPWLCGEPHRQTDHPAGTHGWGLRREPIERLDDPKWRVEDVTLEDLVLAYLADPSAGALPGPSRTDPEVTRWSG